MKVRNQALIIISLTSAAFLTLTCFSVIRESLAAVTILTACFALITTGVLRMYIINRIEKISRHSNSIIHGRRQTDQRIIIEGNDELSSIAINMNALLDTAEAAQITLEKKIQEYTRELAQAREQPEQTTKPEPVKNDSQAQTSHLMEAAQLDQLTALPNQFFFNELLNKAVSYANRNNKMLAVMQIEFDNFKCIAENLGMDKSDFIIKEISRRFTNTLRKEDILARMDNDKFIVLLYDIGKAKFASTVASKLLQVCSHPMKMDDHEFSISASIGICVFPNDGKSLEDLLKHAENTCFLAKANGGNNYQYYTHSMDVEAREYLQLESALRKAMHNNELTLVYQPKIAIKTGMISGVEALMRWEHPVLGVIDPSTFIAVAEETGLIMKIGEWAIREACRTAKFWQDEGYQHMTVGLNLSPRQFHHPEIAKVIANALKITGLNPQFLELEISELTVMNNIELATTILENIRMIGVQIALDHFGTGFTSISALKHFPINTLKIDQTFIKGVPNIPNDMAITSALIALAHHLGFEIAAQGVETAEQVQFLAQQNCDMVQGYFLSHPLPAHKVAQQFKKVEEEALI